MTLTFASVLPPLLVLILGIVTNRVLFSLSCGILTAAFITSGGTLISTAAITFNRLWHALGMDALYSWDALSTNDPILIFFFLINLGTIIVMLEFSGGANAYAATLTKRLQTKTHVEQTSLILSFCFFIDDYFNTLTVGTIMRPLTDSFRIPRAKLAFLIDSMAAPLTVLVPISSWVAVIVGQLTKANIASVALPSTAIIADPFMVYLETIPYILYSFVMIICAFALTYFRWSFGLMKKHEVIAEKTGNVWGGKSSPVDLCPVKSDNTKGSLYDFFVPILMLIATIMFFLFYTGDHYLFGGSTDIIGALRQANPSLALAAGSFITLVVAMSSLLVQQRATIRELINLAKTGFLLMFPAICILWFAWALGDLLRNDLYTGQYLAQTLIGGVPLLFFPAMFFVASSIISFAMGSSWGTVAIAIPIAIPMTINCAGLAAPVPLELLPIILPVLGAILSGAVLGDHISPISDTTIMSSTSTNCHHLDHVYTQFMYIAPIYPSIIIGFIVAGASCHYGTALCSGMALMAAASSALFLMWLASTISAMRKDNA